MLQNEDECGVTHALGEHGQEYPRRLAIDLSIDGVRWDPAWEGNTVGHAFRAAVLAPRDAELRFSFPPRHGRYVRLQQLARHRYTWRVAEIQVHAPPQ